MVGKQCSNEVLLIYLRVSLNHLFIKLLGVNLIPLVCDVAFFENDDNDVQH